MTILSGRVSAGKTTLISRFFELCSTKQDQSLETILIPLSASPILKNVGPFGFVISDYSSEDSYYPGYVHAKDLEMFLNLLTTRYSRFFTIRNSGLDNPRTYLNYTQESIMRYKESVKTETKTPVKPEEKEKDKKKRPSDILIHVFLPGLGTIVTTVDLNENLVNIVYTNRSGLVYPISTRELKSIRISSDISNSDLGIPPNVCLTNNFQVDFQVEELSKEEESKKRPLVIIDSLDNLSSVEQRLGAGGVNLNIIDYSMRLTSMYLEANQLKPLISYNMPSEHLGEIRRKAQRFFHIDIDNMEYDCYHLLQVFGSNIPEPDNKRALYMPTNERNRMCKVTDTQDGFLSAFWNAFFNLERSKETRTTFIDADLFIANSKAIAELTRQLTVYLAKEKSVYLGQTLVGEKFPNIDYQRTLLSIDKYNEDKQRVIINADKEKVKEAKVKEEEQKRMLQDIVETTIDDELRKKTLTANIVYPKETVVDRLTSPAEARHIKASSRMAVDQSAIQAIEALAKALESPIINLSDLVGSEGGNE